MRLSIFAVAGLLLSTLTIAAPVDLSTRSDDSDDLFFAREPAPPPSRIPRWGGAAALARFAAGIQRPRAPTPNNMRSNTINRPPNTPSPSPPGSPRPRPPSRIPIMRGSNLRGRSDELEDEDEMFARELLEELFFGREPAPPPSRIPRWGGAAALARFAAGIQRPGAPTPNNMRSNTINRPPNTPSPSPPGSPRPRPPSRIPIMRGSNLRGRSDEMDSEYEEYE